MKKLIMGIATALMLVGASVYAANSLQHKKSNQTSCNTQCCCSDKSSCGNCSCCDCCVK